MFSQIIPFINYRICAWLPAGRTHFPVSVRKLERLHQSERFINGSPNRQIVHGDLPQNAAMIDDEQTATESTYELVNWHLNIYGQWQWTDLPQRMAQIVQIDAVVFGDLVRQVAEQRNLQGSQSAFLARRIDPGQVRKVRVHTAGDHLGVDLLEFGNAIGKGQNFGRTNECTGMEVIRNVIIITHIHCI